MLEPRPEIRIAVRFFWEVMEMAYHFGRRSRQ